MEHYSALKRNEILTHTTTWMNIKNFMLRASQVVQWMDRNPSASAGDMGSVLDPRRSHMLQSNSARVS